MKEEATLITEITPEVRSFLEEHIHSVWQLELLMYLRDSNRKVTLSEIAKALYSSANAIESTVVRFVDLGIIESTQGEQGTYSYAPSSPELRKVVDDATDTYRARRLDVINVIFASPTKAPRLSLD